MDTYTRLGVSKHQFLCERSALQTTDSYCSTNFQYTNKKLFKEKYAQNKICIVHGQFQDVKPSTHTDR